MARRNLRRRSFFIAALAAPQLAQPATMASRFSHNCSRPPTSLGNVMPRSLFLLCLRQRFNEN